MKMKTRFFAAVFAVFCVSAAVYAEDPTPAAPATAPSPDAMAPVHQFLYDTESSVAIVGGIIRLITSEIRLGIDTTKETNDLNKVNEKGASGLKAALAAFEGNDSLRAALKDVRAAQIAMISGYSSETRAGLDAAIGKAKVELELIE
jgi:hypothetical protein